MGKIVPCTDLSKAAWVRRPQGVIVVDGIEVASTYTCCHCNMPFMCVRGSGVERGFCMNCMGNTCGAKGCCTCVPFEKQLDRMEK